MHAGRRKFLKQSFLGLAGLGVAVPFLYKRKIASFLKQCPFDDSVVAVADDSLTSDPVMAISDLLQKDFAGDRPSRAHKALWDKDNYIKAKGGIPAPSEDAPIVVVGGGISGLTAMYQLAEAGISPVLLEQAPQFGGNSKAESWQGSTYTIGAAYISEPEDGSLVQKLIQDLNLESKFRSETGRKEAINMNGKLTFPFWEGVTDPARAEEFKKIFEKLLALNESGVPVIPPPANDPAKRAELNRLDAMSFADWVKQELGEVHPHIEELFREYCWSAFCTDYEEVSAAQALNFLCADLNLIQAVPGGNAGIAQAMVERLQTKLPKNSLRAASLTLDISQDANGARICYEGPDGQLKTIHAKAVIVTSPKFISKIVVSSLPDDQYDAMDNMTYRAYVVANVVLKHPLKSPGYDVYCMTGTPPTDPKDIKKRVWTDMTYATWLQDDQTPNGVISLFRPYAYDGGRKELFQNGAFEKVKADVQAALPGLLQNIGIDPSSILGIRLSRWGHSLPVATKNLIASGALEKASQPFGRVLFAQQDNWASPCFETAVQVAGDAADAARRIAGLS